MEIEEFNDVELYGGLLPGLRQLCLEHVSFTSIVAHNSPWRMMKFKMLNHLTVCSSNQLKHLLPLDVLEDLQQLKTIDISDCEQLEHLFVDEQDLQTTMSNVMEVLPLLHSLTLINLPELARICSADAHFTPRSLTQMTVESCPKFIFTFVDDLRSIKEEDPSKKKSKEMILTPSILENLNLRRVDHLKNMCEDPKDGASVRWLALETVQVAQCSYIQKSMLGTVDRPLLKNVKVSNCPPWESGDVESDIGYLFELPDEHLIIKDSKQLKNYMEMGLQQSSFTQLKTIEALQCDNDLNEFLSILLRRSYKLEQLTIKRCELLQHVLDLTEFIADYPRGVVGLRKLVKLEIIECGLRKSPLSTALVQELVLLETLKIESCEMIEQVIEDDTEMQESSFRNLKDFQLASLPNLIKLNSGHCNVKFPELLSLRIENCPKFLSNRTQTIEGTSDHVPQNEMMHACPKLRTLKLAGLEMLEDIWQGQDYRIPLCDLRDVEVDSFSKLRYMWIAKSENLERLVVRNCNSLGRLVLPSNCFNLREIMISDCNILEEICIEPQQQQMNEKTIPHLEYIVLENLPKPSFFPLETCKFASLLKLRIVNCPTLVTLPKNGSATVDNSLNMHSELVLFEDIEEDSHPGVGKMKVPPQLESLELMGLPTLQLWTREPKILVFEKLTSLKIINCGSFKKLFSISGAKQLSSLKLLALYGCVDMVHVLQGEGQTGLQVVFKKLEKLVLKHLPKLTSFCEEDVDFGELPELKMVIVEDIPNMNTFVKKPLSTPKLKQVHVTYIRKCWLGDLNQTIKDLHQNHDKLKEEVWESDQSSTRPHSDTAESSSLQEISRGKGKAPME